MGNGLAQSPLHLAVGWPEGIRILLHHGACADSRDQNGDTPLYYALDLGYSQTVCLLMKADCSLVVPWNILTLASDLRHSHTGGVSEDVRIKVLDTTIASLAERRRDLQSRLTGLPVAVSMSATVLQEDRVLDEYAEYAECTERAAQQIDDNIPLRASSLLEEPILGKRRTVYHISGLVVKVAEKLWENGFRDIDVPDNDGLTPLALSDEIELCSWLIQKGAKLHRPQHRLNSPDPAMDPTELLHTTRALHYVAARIASDIDFMIFNDDNWLSRESKLLLATVFSDGSSDDCICACSSRGCLASTLMLKVVEEQGFPLSNEANARDRSAGSIECLMDLVGPQSSCWDWLAKEIIRVCTFQELELRHTCCSSRYGMPSLIIKFEEEERAEIQDEDKDKIALLESLLLEFEEHKGAEDLVSFLKGYWAVRMDEVLGELKSGVDEEGIRGIGVVLEEDFDGERGSTEEMYVENTAKSQETYATWMDGVLVLVTRFDE